MKRLLVLMLLMLFTPPLLAAQQVSRYDNIAIGNLAGGNLLQALPNATIQVSACSSMSASCTLPANLCSSIVDTNCGLPGVLTADSGGNFHFYARAGRYQIVIVAAGFQTRTIPDVILPLSVSDGAGVGTQVIVNGTAAVPNSLNFNSVAPQPPANSTIIRWNLNGNNVLGYFSGSGNATDCLLGTGVFGPCPGGGGGGSLTVNGGTGGSDLNDILPTFPPNGINISWQAANGHISGAILGDGIGTHCFLGTGVFAQCPGSGAAGVSSINGLTGALTFTGSVSCSGATCNFPGGSGGGLPTIPQYNLFASNGTGGAQDSTIKAGPPGFLQAEVVTATGDITSAAAPFQLFPNAGVEYFPSGYTWSGGTSGATNGLAMYMSHSAGSAASSNGGVALGGGNSSGTGNQVYLDCEVAGCDFKVPVTYLGAGIGGGGGGSGTVASGTGNYFAWYPSTGTTVNSNSNLSDNGALITSQEPLAAPGINVTGNGGIAMTGAGGTLPAPVAGQGGIGIGLGNVPEYYSNGGAWTAIGSGGAAGVTSINTVAGPFTFSGSGVSCASTTCTFSGGGAATVPNPILTTAGATLPAPTTGQGSIGIAPNGVPSISISGGNWLPIATSSGGTSVPIAHGAQTPVCQAGSTASPIVISGLTINNGDTVLVGVASYLTDANWTVVDNNGDSYPLTGAVERQNSATALIYASAVGAARAANSITVTLTSATFRKTVVCVATYTGVTALGTTNGSTGASGVSNLHRLSLTAAAAGNFLFTMTGVMSSAVSSSFTTTPGNGTLLAWGATTTTAAASGAICENQATSAGSVTCEAQSSSINFNWSMAGIELVGGGTGGGSVAPTIYTCTIPANVTFTTTAGTICSQALGATAKQWQLHCNIPWNFTAGSGTSNVEIGINLSAAPTYSTYVLPVMWTTTGPSNYGAVQISLVNHNPVVTPTGLTAGSGGTIYSLMIDGTFAAPANTTFSIYGTASVGTAAFRPGVACVLQ